MSVLYFDCSSGLSGQMILGALLELCSDSEFLKQELAKLPISDYQISISKTNESAIVSTYVEVSESAFNSHKQLSEMIDLIDRSEIYPEAKEISKNILQRIALAKNKVYGESENQCCFLSLCDLILVVGAAVLITYLHPDKIYCSIVNDGIGMIDDVGQLQVVPAPDVSEIFAGSHIIFRQMNVNAELVTPVGAAIIAELAEGCETMPTMEILKIGWGCGRKDFKVPQVLRAFVGTIPQHPDDVIVVETNIDDCSGEMLGFTMEKLMAIGARDVFFTPIFMKKNRPAYCLTVICMESDLKAVQDVIFKHTTTIGMRYRREKRAILKRKMIVVKTPYGEVHAKQVEHEGRVYTYPEYEDAKRIALAYDLPIKEVMRLIQISIG